MEHDKQVVFVCIVAKRKQKDEIIAALQKIGVNLTNIIYGKGAVVASFFQSIFGLVPELNKVILLSMTTIAKSEVVFDTLVNDFDFNKPNTGIAFTIPVEAISF